MINQHIFIHYQTRFLFYKVHICTNAPQVMRTCRNLVMAEIDVVIRKKFRNFGDSPNTRTRIRSGCRSQPL